MTSSHDSAYVRYLLFFFLREYLLNDSKVKNEIV